MYPKSELKLEGEGSKQELVVTIRIDTKWLDAQFASELAGQLRNEATTMVDRWYRDNGRGDVQKIFRESFENATVLVKEHLARWDEPELKKYAELEFKRRIDGVVEEALDELKQRILRGTRPSEGE